MNKNISYYTGGVIPWAADVCSRTALAVLDSIVYFGGAENAGPENAGPENAGPSRNAVSLHERPTTVRERAADPSSTP